MKVLGALAVAVLLTQLIVYADEWPEPRVQNVFSVNGRYFVRVIPSANVVNGAVSARKARSEFYERQPDRSYRLIADVELQNQVSPTYAVVTDDGYLVTFDEWFQIGMGHVMAFYRPTGALIRAVKIDDLYTPDKLSQIPRSTSSRWWRCGVRYTPPIGANEASFTVTEHFGGTFELHPSTGTFDYRAGTAACPPGEARTF